MFIYVLSGCNTNPSNSLYTFTWNRRFRESRQSTKRSLEDWTREICCSQHEQFNWYTIIRHFHFTSKPFRSIMFHSFTVRTKTHTIRTTPTNKGYLREWTQNGASIICMIQQRDKVVVLDKQRRNYTQFLTCNNFDGFSYTRFTRHSHLAIHMFINSQRTGYCAYVC